MLAACVSKLDLVPVLDLARGQHDLLAVDDLDAFFLQRVEHRGFGVVHAHRHVGHARVLDQLRDHLGVFAHQPEFGRDGAAHADDTGEAVVGLQPVGIALVVHGGRAEVPDIGESSPVSRQKRHILSRSHSPILVAET
jgi:hypothetical protein